ncbi:helix-turn-helix domain-containing protein [Cerasibacillus sp. JNUCC 74]
MNILIIDRDTTERTGIEWFVRSNQLPFQHIYHAENIKQANMLLSKVKPHVVILELEILSKTNFESFSMNVFRFSERLITMTAEPVFERAYQAIELESKSLLVKPLNLNQLMKALTNAAQTEVHHSDTYFSRNQEIYHSLFIKAPLTDSIQPYFLLIEAECATYTIDLFHWLHKINLPFTAEFFPLRNKVVCLAYTNYSFTINSLKTEAYKMIQLWKEEFDSNINIAIHNSYIKSDNLQQAYVATKNILHMRFYKGFNQVFLSDELNKFISFDPFLTSTEQRFWMECLEKGDMEGIKDYLYKQFTNPFHEYPEPEIVRIQLTSILAQIRRFINNYKLAKIEDIENKYHRMFQIILNSPILYTIVQEIILFCINVIHYSGIQKEKRDFNYVERSIRYIEHHFRNKYLRLEDIANQLEISPNYLSHLLSSEEKPFRRLVNEYRINEAKKLLRNTNESIQNISDLVGFKDPNYFSRVFKRFTNSTPNYFRQTKT